MPYIGFGPLESKLSKKYGKERAGAIAASIGRKKYGKAKFQKAAAQGKSMRGMEHK